MDTKLCDKSQTLCPLTRVLAIISSKWALPVIFQLHCAEGPLRFGELKRNIGTVTQKELTRALREFERPGLVDRRVFAEVPPRVEYSLTALGRSLREPITALGDWARKHGTKLAQRDAASRKEAA